MVKVSKNKIPEGWEIAFDLSTEPQNPHRIIPILARSINMIDMWSTGDLRTTAHTVYPKIIIKDLGDIDKRCTEAMVDVLMYGVCELLRKKGLRVITEG